MTQSQSPYATFRTDLSALYPRLWRYAVALTGRRDWADDLAQSACLRALEKFELFREDTHLDRWVFTIAHRIWLNDLRARKIREGNGTVAVEDTPLRDNRSDTEMNILAREVLTKVQDLPDAQRAVVFLVYVEGYRYKDVAEMMDIPVGTVMSRLAAARKRLSTELGDSRKAAE